MSTRFTRYFLLFTFLLGAATAAEARFDKLDQNSDGATSFEEFNAFVVVTLSFASARTPEKAFAKKDRNGDGRISRVEFIGSRVGEKAARAGRRFDKLDQDQDGALTLGEWKARFERKRGKNRKT